MNWELALFVAITALVALIDRMRSKRSRESVPMGEARPYTPRALDGPERRDAPAIDSRPVPCPLVREWPTSWRRLDRQDPEPNRPDVLDAGEWDAWWLANHVSAEASATEHVHYYEVVQSLLPFIGARPGARVLSAGCGISLESRALAAAGVCAVGLDISERAIAHARTCIHFEEKASRFLSPAQRRPGGSAEWIIGSILDSSACPGPFDAIICRKVLQYFWRQGHLDEAIVALTERLVPDGVLVVTAHGDVPSFTAIPAAFLRHGYAWDWSVNLWARAPICATGGAHRLLVFASGTG